MRFQLNQNVNHSVNISFKRAADTVHPHTSGTKVRLEESLSGFAAFRIAR